jgi:uncharacterized protein YggU (UPF0235/DUF167 family)
MLISIFVKSAAARNKVGGSHDGRLIVSVMAAAVDGAANAAVISTLAKVLKIPKSDIRVKSGLTSKRKVIEIAIEIDEIQRRISELQNQH